MPDSVIDLPLPDATARQRIVTVLDANILVEAGAGSGKTTELVARLVALVETGVATVDELAAVTFTRKAASELRERFQAGIERALRTERPPEPDGDLRIERLRTALDDIDRAFIGTIHSFCGRLLRERPLEVGLDPGFEELAVEERALLHRRFWTSYLERLARDSDPLLEDLARAGVPPSSLFGLFQSLVENPDVTFPAEEVGAPSFADVGPIRVELEAIVDRGWELMDDVRPEKDWDSLQKKIRRLHFERDVTGWTEPADFFDAVAVLCKPGPRGHQITLNRWRDGQLAKGVREGADAFGVGDTPAHRMVDQWYAHRYSLAIRLGRAAAEAFAAHRLRIGKLDFQDLLLHAARLLRTRPDVRRQLGQRYRRLLVDEFQDTDPLQAEIMLLLASEPDEPDGNDGGEGEPLADWRTAVPREGALFVVGDPKQSIYRFRRADIQLYGFVKERFAQFGEVLGLSTNFRSRPGIGDIVNAVFDREEFFPSEATSEQAAFERLATRPPTTDVPCEGVFWYAVGPDANRKDAVAADDAGRLSAWIRARIDAGERTPGDFLVLTRDRGQLAAYATAFESHGLPVQVTGAGVGVAEELHELGVVLECMIDPTNPVKVVSALVGLFFGIDYERLVAHRLDGGSLDAMWPGDEGDPDVLEALGVLRGWWRRSTSRPADVFIGALASELGLLPYAAAGDLGTLRAGALLYALDAVRAAALAGDTSLPGALDALRSALDLREAEAPLEPGRPDVIRLMNLHQAKGLEGTVVVLANPSKTYGRTPDLHLTRGRNGRAEGYLRVTGPSSGWGAGADLARPLGWGDRQAAEERFTRAEEVRLLYVAATRAREELVVARWPAGRGSAWAAFEEWLDRETPEGLSLELSLPAARPGVALEPEDVGRMVDAAARALEASGRPTYEHTTVTRLTKGVNPDASDTSRGGREPAGTRRDDFRGFAWGSAVHGALAIAVTEPPEEALRSACRDLLVEQDRPLDDHGEPVELLELLDLVRSVRDSDLWARARASERCLVEVSFALPGMASDVRVGSPGKTVVNDTNTEARREASGSSRSDSPEVSDLERRQLDLFGAPVPDQDGSGEEVATGEPASSGWAPADPDGAEPDEAGVDPLPDDGRGASPTTVVEGVVDLAFHEEDGWVIADYKTDVGTDPDFVERSGGYRRQVELYAEAWSRLTGQPVKERVLFFTAQGRVESW